MEYTTTDLERQDAQLLPEREALGFFNYAGLTANNTALALNAGSWMSRAARHRGPADRRRAALISQRHSERHHPQERR